MDELRAFWAYRRYFRRLDETSRLLRLTVAAVSAVTLAGVLGLWAAGERSGAVMFGVIGEVILGLVLLVTLLLIASTSQMPEFAGTAETEPDETDAAVVDAGAVCASCRVDIRHVDFSASAGNAGDAHYSFVSRAGADRWFVAYRGASHGADIVSELLADTDQLARLNALSDQFGTPWEALTSGGRDGLHLVAVEQQHLRSAAN